MTISNAQIALARKALAKLDPALAKANKVTPAFEWRSKARGFAGLVRLITEQQVSVAAADSIWKRLQEGLGILTVERVLAHDVDQLKTFGLSAPKARYIRGVAEAHASGAVDLDELAHLDDDAASAKLIALNGVGRWTAEAYLMGCEARTDVFPAGDIALQEAVRILDGKAARPSIEELYLRSEKWRPHRSIAAHMLWAYYTGIKRNTIPMPQGVPPMVKLKNKSKAGKIAPAKTKKKKAVRPAKRVRAKTKRK